MIMIATCSRAVDEHMGADVVVIYSDRLASSRAILLHQRKVQASHSCRCFACPDIIALRPCKEFIECHQLYSASPNCCSA